MRINDSDLGRAAQRPGALERVRAKSNDGKTSRLSEVEYARDVLSALRYSRFSSPDPNGGETVDSHWHAEDRELAGSRRELPRQWFDRV